MHRSPWTSFGAGLLGLWLLASPSTFNYQAQTLSYSDWISGIILLILGFGCRLQKTVLIAWGYAMIGFWLGLAPLVFWAPDAACYLNNTIVSMLLFALFIRMPVVPNQLPDTGPSIPPGWSYNPSSWPQRLPIALLAFIGWMFSRYMAAYQLGYIDSVWDPFFPNGTLDVITSDVSKAFPVADAGLGAFAYSLEMLSAFKGGEQRWRTMPWMVVVFGLLAVPLSLTSVLLIILQPLIVGAWCTLCLATAFCMLILVALSIDEVAAVIQYLRKSKEKPFLSLLCQGGLCPGAMEDRRTPILDAPLKTLLRASRWGVTVPWNLAASVLLGAWLMLTPSIFGLVGRTANIDHIFGAFTIVASMIALAETTRSVRYLNLLFAGVILVSSFFQCGCNISIPLGQIVVAALLALLSLRKGPIREKSTFQ